MKTPFLIPIILSENGSYFINLSKLGRSSPNVPLICLWWCWFGTRSASFTVERSFLKSTVLLFSKSIRIGRQRVKIELREYRGFPLRQGLTSDRSVARRRPERTEEAAEVTCLGASLPLAGHHGDRRQDQGDRCARNG
jgi:hypothetical protein